MKSLGGFSQRLGHGDCVVKSLLSVYSLVTRKMNASGTFTFNLPNDDNIIVMTSGDWSESNSDCDFTVESPNDGHFRVA